MHYKIEQQKDREQHKEIIQTLGDRSLTRKELQLECHMGRHQLLQRLKELREQDLIHTADHPEDKRKTVYTKA